jgi:hypothetical protein
METYWLDRRAYRKRTHFRRRPSLLERSRERAIEDWYGPEQGCLEMLAHRRPARPIAGVVDEVFTELGGRDLLLLSGIQAHWRELVGPDVAAQAAPSSVDGSTLRVEVANATWRYVLENEHREQISARVAAFTAGKVTEVNFVPGGRTRRRQ